MKPPPIILTIAGSDSGAGAGIQADARAIHAAGGFACTAITAITAQNTRRVVSWRALTPDLIEAQVGAVLDDLPVAAVKTGLLPGAAAVRAVARALAGRNLPLVVDPVLGSTSGTRFLNDAGVSALRRHLLPLATLVTPNWPEAEALTGRRIRTDADAALAAGVLAEDVGCAVLLKGGHSPDSRCRDVLAWPDGRRRLFAGKRIQTANTHGTGCALSAAIAAGLARGMGLPEAVAAARSLLRRALAAGRAVRWGAGRGPALPGMPATWPSRSA